MFDKKIFQKNIIGFLQRMRATCLPDGAPFDVFPDLSYIHCYPARKLSGQNILKFSRLSEALREIAFLKRTIQSIEKNKTPPECRACEYYKTKRCDSLCLGCQEFTAEFLGS